MLEAFVDAMLDAIASGEPLPPTALRVLLRVYAETGRDDLGAVLGAALAAAAATPHDAEPAPVRAGWLQLFAEAARLSDDARLLEAAEAVAAGLRRVCDAAAQPALTDTAEPALAAPRYIDRAVALEAVLAACAVMHAERFGPDAIDQLERVVAADYAPGDGLRGRDVAEVTAVALALLAAFDLTGRLAYPMLAEELIRSVRPRLDAAPPPACCAAARVLGRLARLHADDGYRATAVLAPDADYAAACRTLLDAAAPRCRAPEERSAYALALTECGERS